MSTEARQLSSKMPFFMKVIFPTFWGSLRGQISPDKNMNTR